ncbi:MAG: serine/threonine-protein kinase, partial [Myxococcota bacterium]
SVAIKVLRPDTLSVMDTQERETLQNRFLQEAQAAAALTHPGVTTIYRVGMTQGTAFIAMEWLEGEDLEVILEREGKLPADRVARLGVELMEALHAAHEVGVVHRDIKPSNLIVLTNHHLKIADFGIARIAGSELVKTKVGAVVGTPMFASPEQFLGAEVDGRSDIFSAGVVLYNALAGSPPFKGNTIASIGVNIVHSPTPPLLGIVPNAPEGLAAIIERALSKHADERFPSALAMAEALRPFATPLTASQVGGSGELSQIAGSSTGEMGETYEPLTITTEGGGGGWTTVMKAVLAQWPVRSLGRISTSRLLAKLHERPLDAPPFAGAVVCDGRRLLWAYNGLIIAALDLQTGGHGDQVLGELPEQSQVELYKVPEGSTSRMILGLAALLHPEKLRHQGLDAAFVNMPAMIDKLASEGWSGTLRLTRDDGRQGYLIFCRERTTLQAFVGDWSDIPIHDERWQAWIGPAASRTSLSVDLLEWTIHPTLPSRRHDLKSTRLDLDAQRLPVLHLPDEIPLASTDDRLPPSLARAGMLKTDPTRALLAWMNQDLKNQLDKASSWKYLAGWLDDIDHALLYHDLPRPDSRETDPFDLVTLRSDGFVLHLAQQITHGTVEALEQFVERVVAAKRARIAMGHIGGAILVAPSFDDVALDHYRDLIQRKPQGGWFAGLQEAFTGYEGFVRMGSRRGFHLLLVETDGRGSFRAVSPHP